MVPPEPLSPTTTYVWQATDDNGTTQVGPATPVKVAGKDATWDWDGGQAVLTFKGTLDTPKTMKGDIEVQGVTGSFTAAKE